jgi:hypothetical protein
MVGRGQTEVIDMAPAELDRWKKAVAGIEANFIKNNKNKNAGAFVADIKKLAAKYAAMAPNDVMAEVINNPAQGMY